MAINVRNEGAKVNSNINVTPMVDVMLVLLIIFMVITPMLQKGQSVDLAKANNPTPMTDADKEDAVIVAVMRDGQVFLDTQKVTPEELTQKVKDRISTRTKKQVFVKADARAKYKGVVEVVDDVRSAGVDEVGLLTEQRQNPNKPAPH
jgi:biopolymer transport protein ExbD/biopolymer transport protein TolR